MKYVGAGVIDKMWNGHDDGDRTRAFDETTMIKAPLAVAD